jgi:hypothetical protein
MVSNAAAKAAVARLECIDIEGDQSLLGRGDRQSKR